MPATQEPVVIYDRTVNFGVGSYIKPENWAFGNNLEASDWDAAAFFLPTNSGGPIKRLAVNITITGKTVQRFQGSNWIRVKIESVGDGEPSTFFGGWLLIRGHTACDWATV